MKERKCESSLSLGQVICVCKGTRQTLKLNKANHTRTCWASDFKHKSGVNCAI